MSEIKICAWCKSPFAADTSNKTCCSEECAKARKLDGEKRWQREQRRRDKEQLESMRPRRRGKPKMSIGEASVAATAAGMTYGKYIAMVEYGMAVER